MKKRQIQTHLLDFTIIILFSVLFLYSFLKPNFIVTHEVQSYFQRLFQVDVAIRDGHFPVRWFPDFALGFGYPFLNYYAPLFFYIAEVLVMLGFSFLAALKIVAVFDTLLGSIGLYFLAATVWGRWAGLTAAVIFTFAPYRILNLYLRGDLAEYTAMAFIPWVLLFHYQLIKERKMTSSLLGGVSLALLISSHNVTALIFVAFLLGFDLVTALKEKKFPAALLALSYGLGLGLSAFFWIPALFERHFVNIENMTRGFYDFHHHFVNPPQLIISYLGIAPLQLLLFSAIFIFLCRKKEKEIARYFLYLAILLVATIFLMVRPSTFVWESIPLMRFIQFPPRFLSIASVMVSFLCVALVAIITTYTPHWLKIAIPLILAFACVTTISYCKGKEKLVIDEKIFTRTYYREKHITTTAANEYLPGWVESSPGSSKNAQKLVSLQTDELLSPAKTAKAHYYQFKVDAEKDGYYIFGQNYFPGWHYYVDGKARGKVDVSSEGLIRIFIPAGSHQVTLHFQNTPLRLAANYITLLTFIAFLVLLLKGWIRRTKTNTVMG